MPCFRIVNCCRALGDCDRYSTMRHAGMQDDKRKWRKQDKIAKVREVGAEKDSHWPLLLKKATTRYHAAKRGSNSVLETKPQRNSTTSKIAAMWPIRLHLGAVEALPDGQAQRSTGYTPHVFSGSRLYQAL